MHLGSQLSDKCVHALQCQIWPRLREGLPPLPPVPCSPWASFLTTNATPGHFVYGPCLPVPGPCMEAWRQQGRAGFEARPGRALPSLTRCVFLRSRPNLSELPLESKATRELTPDLLQGSEEALGAVRAAGASKGEGRTVRPRLWPTLGLSWLHIEV